MLDVRLYLAQRISAAILVPMVLGHLGVMIYAIQGGLTVDEILGRTRGSVFWLVYYGSFVAAVSVHASIGLRVIAGEWLHVPAGWGRALQYLVLFGFTALGARAVAAVYLA